VRLCKIQVSYILKLESEEMQNAKPVGIHAGSEGLLYDSVPRPWMPP
jgi:hypothetical protein